MPARLRSVLRTPLESLDDPARTGRLYAVVDSARDDTGTKPDYLPPDATVVRLLPREGEDPAGLPWLVALTPPHLVWLRQRDAADPWGILVQSDSDFETLAATLGRYLVSVDTNGEEVLVRFFDPRVLPLLLRAFDASELAFWYSRVSAYGRTFQAEVEWYNVEGLSPESSCLPENTFCLRYEHMRAFEDLPERLLTDEIRCFLARQMPGVVDGFDADILHQMIAWGVVCARSYGLSRTAELAAFVALMFDVAPNFHLQPAIHAQLASQDSPSDDRLRRAIAHGTEDDWAAAAAAYDWTAWFPPGHCEVVPDERLIETTPRKFSSTESDMDGWADEEALGENDDDA